MEVREVIVALSSGNGINSKLKIMEVGIEPEQKLESSWLISGQLDITTDQHNHQGWAQLEDKHAKRLHTSTRLVVCNIRTFILIQYQYNISTINTISISYISQ